MVVVVVVVGATVVVVVVVTGQSPRLVRVTPGTGGTTTESSQAQIYIVVGPTTLAFTRIPPH
jgi:hypothetical protein